MPLSKSSSPSINFLSIFMYSLGGAFIGLLLSILLSLLGLLVVLGTGIKLAFTGGNADIFLVLFLIPLVFPFLFLIITFPVCVVYSTRKLYKKKNVEYKNIHTLMVIIATTLLFIANLPFINMYVFVNTMSWVAYISAFIFFMLLNSLLTAILLRLVTGNLLRLKITKSKD